MSRAEVDASNLVIKAFGVPIEITVSDRRLWPEVQSVLPPGATPAARQQVTARFAISEAADGTFDVSVNDRPIARGHGLEVAFGALGAQMEAVVAANARDWVFVHAGAVAGGERGLLLPGPSFSGKTTLVRALVRAGATYYSDEFAVLDDDGRLHAYPKPLGELAPKTTDEQVGAGAELPPVKVGVIALASYRSGASWQPEQRPATAGALALLSHTAPAQERPQQALHAIRLATADATVLEGERGEADPAAAALVAVMSR